MEEESVKNRQSKIEELSDEISQKMFDVPFDELSYEQAKKVKTEALAFIEERKNEILFQRGGVTDSDNT